MAANNIENNYWKRIGTDLSPKVANDGILLEHTAAEADDHALELDVGAAGYGDVKALDIDYVTGAISAGEDEGVILVNINEIGATGGDVFAVEVLATDGGAGIYGLKAGALVGPVHQDSGTFANPTTGTDNTASTDVPAMIDGSILTTTAIFENNSEYIIIGAAAAFEEIEFILTTDASVSIKPTFWYSIAGTGQFTQFTPVDGTNGFRNTGVVSWDASDLTGHVADDVTGTFDIKIIRTRNTMATTPVLGYAKVAATTEYIWDKDGGLSIASINVNDGNITNVGDIALDSITADDGTGPIVLNDDLRIIDGEKLFLGTGDDGQLYSSSDDLYIDNVTQDKDIIFRINDGGAQTEVMRIDGDVSMVGIGTATPSAKLEVVGNIFASDGSVQWQNEAIGANARGIVWSSDSAAHRAGMRLRRGRGTEASPAAVEASDELAEIQVQGYYDASNFSTQANLTFLAAENWSATNRGTDIVLDGTLNATTTVIDVMRFKGAGEIVFNEDSADIDFRIESDGNANMFFVDAGNNRIGFGTNSPDYDIELETTSANATLVLTRTDGAQTRLAALQNQGVVGTIDSNPFRLITANTARVEIDASGNFIFNDSGAAVDFRIEGDTNANLFFVDGSADNIGIGVSDPDTLLEIYKVGTQLKLSGGAADYATFAVAADGALTITTVDADAAEGDIILSPDGNVGIAQTNPSEKLDVVGNLELNGNLDITGYIKRDGTTYPYLIFNADGTVDMKLATSAGTSYFEIQNSGGGAVTRIYDDGNIIPQSNKGMDLGTTALRWNTLHQGTSTAAGTSRTFKAKKKCPLCKTVDMIRGTGSLCILGEDRDYEVAMCPDCGVMATEELKHLPAEKLKERKPAPEITFKGFKVFPMSGNSRKVRVDFSYGTDGEKELLNSTYLGEQEIEDFLAMSDKERKAFLKQLGQREWEALEEDRLMGEEIDRLQGEFDETVTDLAGANLLAT
jgi:hypothetical protein